MSIVLAAGCGHVEPTGPVPPGEVLRFSLEDLHGRTVKASEYEGRVLLVDIWATWCEPCERSLPFLADLRARLSGQRFDVVSVSIDEDSDALEAHLKDLILPYPVLRDPEARLLRRLGGEGVPMTVLLDRFGRVVFRHQGFAPGDEQRIERAVRYVLADPAAGRPAEARR